MAFCRQNNKIWLTESKGFQIQSDSILDMEDLKMNNMIQKVSPLCYFRNALWNHWGTGTETYLPPFYFCAEIELENIEAVGQGDNQDKNNVENSTENLNSTDNQIIISLMEYGNEISSVANESPLVEDINSQSK